MQAVAVEAAAVQVVASLAAQPRPSAAQMTKSALLWAQILARAGTPWMLLLVATAVSAV